MTRGGVVFQGSDGLAQGEQFCLSTTPAFLQPYQPNCLKENLRLSGLLRLVWTMLSCRH
jgi:hypothetical protein